MNAPLNLAAIAEQRDALRDRKRALATEEKEINAAIEELDTQLFAILDEQGVSGIDANGVTLSISESVVPSRIDWPAVYEYVMATGRFELFERRMSVSAYRELREAGVEIPGTEPFTKRAINMRKYR